MIGNADAVCRREATPAGDQPNAGLLQKSEVECIETIHLGAHPTQKVRHIGTHGLDVQAIGGGIRQLMAGLGARTKSFLGTQPRITQVLDPISLHDRHPRPVTGCPLGGSQATGTRSENDQIKLSIHPQHPGHPIVLTPGQQSRVPANTDNEVKTELWSGKVVLVDTSATVPQLLGLPCR